MKKGKNKKKKVAILTAALALLMIIAGTLAATSYTEWVKNHLQSAGFEKGRVTVVENFPSHTDLSTEMKKEVAVKNLSGTDALVRISFEEMLQKLEDTAAAKGYSNLADTHFPVIVNADEYIQSIDSSGNITATSAYKIVPAANVFTDGGAPITDARLIVKEEGGEVTESFLFVPKTMERQDFPNDFDPNKAGSKIPVINGGGTFTSSPTSTAVVAQKVTGKVEKRPDLNYYVTTSQTDPTKLDENLAYWGYGVELAGVKENDWAGVKVNVSSTATTNKPAASAIAGTPVTTDSTVDNIIKLVLGDSVTSDKTQIATTDWFYNEDDGYFYYTKTLKAGSDATSLVLKAIKFPASTVSGAPTDEVRDDFKIASYNLYVGLEAVPAALSSLEKTSDGGKLSATPDYSAGNKISETNSSGFGFPATPTTGSATEAIKNHLKTQATISE